MTKRTMTPHAAAAKAIRQEFKAAFPGTKFRVRSESFSMGSSVRIEWHNGPTRREVDNVAGKYQYGHFNGMDDSYHMSNSRDDMPQVKFVQYSRTVVIR